MLLMLAPRLKILLTLLVAMILAMGAPHGVQAQPVVGSKSMCIIDTSNGSCADALQASVGQAVSYEFIIDNSFGNTDIPNYQVTEAFSPDFSPIGAQPVICTDQTGAVLIPTISYAGPPAQPPATLTFSPLPAQSLLNCAFNGSFTQPSTNMPNTVSGPNGHQDGDLEVLVSSEIIPDGDFALTKTLLSADTIDLTSASPGQQTARYRITLGATQPTLVGPHFRIFDEMQLGLGSIPLNAMLDPASVSCDLMPVNGPVQNNICALDSNLGNPLAGPGGWQDFISFLFPAPGFWMDAGDTVTLDFDVLLSLPADAGCQRQDVQQLRNAAFLTLANGVTALNDLDPSNNMSGYSLSDAVELNVLTDLPTDAECQVNTGGGTGDPAPASPLKVTKAPVDGPGLYSWGQDIPYQITFENTDPDNAITNLTLYDIVQNLAFTPNFDVQLRAATITQCPAPSVCLITSPQSQPGPLGQIQGYTDSAGLLDMTVDRLEPGASVVVDLVLRYTDPHCDTAPLFEDKFIRNIAAINHLYADPDDPAAQYFGTAIANADVQMEHVDKCDIGVKKAQLTPGPVIFGQPMVYTLVFASGQDTTAYGTVIDALRLVDSNYAQGISVAHSFTCSDNGGVSGYAPGGAGSGVVSYVSQPNQGLRLMDHPGFVTFQQGGELTCTVEITLSRPSVTDPYCFSNINEVPYLENVAVFDQGLYYNSNLAFPTGPQGYNWDAVQTELPRCINASLDKKVLPLVVGPQGPAPSYTVTLQNQSQSGADGDISFAAGNDDGIALLDVFDTANTPALPNLTLTSDPCTGAGAPCTWGSQPDRVLVHDLAAGDALQFTYVADPAPEFTPHELCNDITGAFILAGAAYDPDRWYVQRDMADRACVQIRNTLNITKAFDIPADEALLNDQGNITVDITCTHPDPAITPTPLSAVLNAASSWQAQVFVHVGSNCTVTEQSPPASMLYPHCTWAAPDYAPAQSVITDASRNVWDIDITNSFSCDYTALDILKEVNSPDGPQPGTDQSFGTPPAGMLFDMVVSCTDGVNPDQNYQVQLGAGEIDTLTHIPVGMTCNAVETLPTSTEDGCSWQVGFAPSSFVTVANGQSKSLITGGTSGQSPNQITVHNAYICEDEVPPLFYDLEVIKQVNPGPAAPGYTLHTPPAGASFDITPDCGSGALAPMSFGTNGGSQIVTGQTPGALCTASETINSTGGPNDLCRWRSDVIGTAISATGPNVLTVRNTFECPAKELDVIKTCAPLPASASYPITLDCEIEITGNGFPVPGWFALADFFFGYNPPATMVPLDVTALGLAPSPPLQNCQSNTGPTGSGVCYIDTADLQAAGGTLTVDASVTFDNPEDAEMARNCAVLSDVNDGPMPKSNAKMKSDLKEPSLDDLFGDLEHDCVDIDLPPPSVDKPEGDLSINKQVVKEDGPYKVFELALELTGDPVTAPDLYVLDYVPSGMTVQNAGDANWQCTPLPLIGAGTLTCVYLGAYPINAGPLPSIYVEVIDKGAEHPNCAEIMLDKLQTPYQDSNMANNHDCAEVPTGKPDISIDKTLEDIEPGYGIFSLRVKVDGAPVPSPMLLVTDDVPAGMELSFIGNAPWNCQPAQVQGPDQVTCEYQGSYPIPIGVLPPIRFEAKYEQGVENCALVTTEAIDEGYDDSDLSNNTDCVTTPGTPEPEFGKIKLRKVVTQPDPLLPYALQGWNTAAPPAGMLYQITVSCTDGTGAPAVYPVSVTPSSQVTLTVPAGMSCTTAEAPPAVTDPNCRWRTTLPAPLSVAANGAHVLTVTNRYECKQGIILHEIAKRFSVIKEIDPASAPIPLGTDFPFVVSGCNANPGNFTFEFSSAFNAGNAQQNLSATGGACTVTEQTPVTTLPAGCNWAAPLYSTDNGASWSQTPASITGASAITLGGALPAVRVRNKLVCAPPSPSIQMSKDCVPDPLVLTAPGPQQLTCTLSITGSNLLPNHLIQITDTLTGATGATPVLNSAPVTHSGTQFLGCQHGTATNQVVCFVNSSDLIAQGTLSTDLTVTVDNAWDTGDLQNCVRGVHQAFGAGSYGSALACDDITVITSDAPAVSFAKSCLPNPLEVEAPDDPATLRCKITVMGQALTPGQTIDIEENLTAPGSPYALSLMSVTSMNPDLPCTLTQGAPDQINCATTTDAVIAGGGQLSSWVSIVIENAGAHDTLQNCVQTPAPQGGAKTLPQGAEACVTIPVITGTPTPDPDPTPVPSSTSLKLAKAALGGCSVNRAAQTYECRFGFEITNEGSETYQGPLVISDHFTSGPAVRAVKLTAGPGWSCPGNDAAAATCLKGAGRIDAGGADGFQMQLTLAGLREGGRFCNAARLGLGEGNFARTIVVQEAMRLLGIDGGPSDGRSGPQTQRGVRALQGNLGLAQTGTIDAALLDALGVRTDLEAQSGEICIDLPPMPLPPLQCDARTARNISDTECACRYERMVKRSKTSCACPSGLSFAPGKGCIKVARPRSCPEGQQMINGACAIVTPRGPTCDPVSTVKRGEQCVCRYDGMRRRSAGQCVCSNGKAPVKGRGCAVAGE